MKKLFFIFLLCTPFFFIEQNASAQTLRLDSVVGWPGFVIDSQVVGLQLFISNTGGTNFMGDLAILMNSTQHDTVPDTLYYDPNDTIPGNAFYDTIEITHTFNAADLDDGDNIVVVWPASSQVSVIQDSLHFNLYFNHMGVEENGSPQTVQLFPNPSGEIVHLRIAYPEKVEQVRVYDVLGEDLLIFDSGVSRFNVASLSSGVYFVEVRNKDHSMVVKKFFRD